MSDRPYDLEAVAASYARSLEERVPLSYVGGTAYGSIAVNYACGGLRVDLYGTESRGLVVAAYGEEIAACRVRASYWSRVWELLPRYAIA